MHTMVLLKALLTFLILVPFTVAHSWVEALYKINLRGTLYGDPGYIRGFISRSSSSFNDLNMQYLLPTINHRCSLAKPIIQEGDLMCKNTQTRNNYTSEFRRLVVSPGEYIALLYQENGHVTLPQNTPQKHNSGDVYIYGTSSPSDDDKFLSIHNVWNENGTGGDMRGRLLARRRFDDGRCYQVNEGSISTTRQHRYPNQDISSIQGSDIWCQNDIRIPDDVDESYTLYWVWNWPSTPTSEFPSGQPEIYTSCIDLEIASGAQGGKINYDDTQSLAWSGIKAQLLSLV